MAKKKEQSGGFIWIVTTFALIALLIGLGVSSMDDPTEGQTSIVTTPEANPVVTDVDIDDDAVLGDADAPVTMIIFSDYECPYCERFELYTMPSVKENFVETGLVKVVFRDYPLAFHSKANITAEAAECAGEYGDDVYWDYHFQLVENYNEWTVSPDINTTLISYGSTLGLDISACLEEGRYSAEVTDDMTAGIAAGVSGTPTVFVNGEMHVGALPYEDYTGADGSLQDGYGSILTKAVEAATTE